MKNFLVLLAVLLSFGAHAQYKIAGKVLTSQKSPLDGATVVIKGTTVGAVTDNSGNFNIGGLPSKSVVIKASFVGFRDAELIVNPAEEKTVTIILEEETRITEEVFVRAIRAGSQSPVASSKVNKSQIEKNNLGHDIPYLLSLTPSFVSTSDAGAGVGYTGFRIRGTDANRINVTVNGIPLNDAESHGVFWVNMPDFASSVDNLEVQRGVGTSTHGAAAFGASVNMQTNTMKENAWAEYSGSAGSFNTFKNTVSIGTGRIADHFSFDARLSKISSDGFIDRAWSDLKSYYLSGAYLSGSTILKVNIFSGAEHTYQAWNGVPSARLNNDLEGMKLYEQHGLTEKQVEEMIASNPRTYNIYTYKNETDNYQQDHYQVLFSQQFGPIYTLNAALHYTKGSGYYEQFRKGDKFSKYGLDKVVLGADTIKKTDLVRQKWLDNHFYGGTFALSYNKGKLYSVLGAGWNKYDGNHFGNIIWAKYASNGEKDFEWYRNKGVKTDFNIYLKGNYNISSKFNLYADAQYRNILYSIDGIDDDFRDLTQSHQFNFFNPKLGFNLLIDKQSRAFASWAVGHREPNRSNFTDADEDKVPTFETLNDYEAGYEYRSKKISFGANIYYMDYNNQLILTGEINDVGSAIMTNVEESYRLGIELMASVKLLSNLKIDANLTISQNKIINFKEYVDIWDTGEQEVKYLGTTNIAFSPNTIANGAISYEPFKKLELSLISQFVGKQHIDNTSNNDRLLDPYWTNNLKTSYTIVPAKGAKEIVLHVLVNNLLNSEYETNAWVYSYIYGDGRYKMDGYYPQAGINFLAGVTFKF